VNIVLSHARCPCDTSVGAAPRLTAWTTFRCYGGCGTGPNGGVAGVASTAAIAALEVSKAVRMKGVEAPDGDSSFVALDQERRGQVDEDGLPVVYDKDLIEKYWYLCPPPIHVRLRGFILSNKHHPVLLSAQHAAGAHRRKEPLSPTPKSHTAI
jgi:hypothetical protein